MQSPLAASELAWGAAPLTALHSPLPDLRLQHIEELPSARLPSRWGFLLRPAAQFAALFAVCAAVHSCGRAVSVVGSLAVGAAAAGWGLSRSSLNMSGAVSVSALGGLIVGRMPARG